MFRTLLTPLRSRFDASPRSPAPPLPDTPVNDQTPEDFARDVLVELMRNSVEELKVTESLDERMKILVEIHRIMNQNAITKDVFREMDGFLSVYNVLSAARTQMGGSVEGTEDIRKLEVLRLVLNIVSDATYQHDENAKLYKQGIGYEPLSYSINDLSSTTETTTAALGLLLSFMIHDFTVSSIFKILQESRIDSVDNMISKVELRLQDIYHPNVLPLLWSLTQRVWTRPSIRYGFSKILERLASTRHRNLAVMSNADIVMPILEHFSASKTEGSVSEKERHVWQKLLRRFLEMGATTTPARFILQKAIQEGDKLDVEMLDLIRFGMKSRWLDHFSLESSSGFVLEDGDVKGLPQAGFTFMTWIWLARLPEKGPLTLFNTLIDTNTILTFSLRSDGRFQLATSTNRDSIIFSKATIRKARWTHIVLVHYPSRSNNPSIRLFVDGVIQDGVNWPYPKPDPKSHMVKYTIGNGKAGTAGSWCFSSVHLLALPLVDDLIRFIHHLGPRYIGNFQDSSLIKFLTYEASTSLNMFLTSLGSKHPSQINNSAILKSVRHGMGLSEGQIIFSMNSASVPEAGIPREIPLTGFVSSPVVEGDVLVVKAGCFDNALWRLGGAAIALRLVQLAQTPHELSRTLGILTDGLKNSWQNSEDMERLRGYDILADTLRRKGQHVNLTSFETLFEFFGVNPRNPEQSTIVNLVAYRAIALDFELWSRTRREIQVVYFEHFRTLLGTSRYQAFNVTQRFSKMGLVRRLLFVLQTEWFSGDMVDQLIETMRVYCQADFSRDGTIKPLVSYIAANLHEDPAPPASPRSSFSRLDVTNSRQKCERLLRMLVTILSEKKYHDKFVAVLPLTRICLLFLSDKPSPAVATQVVRLLDISIGFSASFIRKFELISGWNVLKTVLPFSWSAEVNDAAFNLLLGKAEGTQQIKCPQIVPTILSTLQHGLGAVASSAHLPEDADVETLQLIVPNPDVRPGVTFTSFDQVATLEALTEELLNLHSSIAQFRSLFQSQITTQLFVDAYKTFVGRIASISQINARTLRILEKMTHFGLALALDNAVAGSQKREILDTLPIAESILTPDSERTAIDPSLVADTRSVRQRLASARFSLQVGERTIIKIVTRIGEWRKTIQASERKRLRKSILDLQETRRQVAQLQEWTHLLISERGLWPMQEKRFWRLDETEGPYRIRKKLEPEVDNVPNSRADIRRSDTRDVQTPEVETNQQGTEIPPWAESYEISSTEVDEPHLAEDVQDDKLRRVRHELEPGDVIDAVATIARIAGVDSSPGLLIIGRTHLYMLDGVVENDDGEVIDAHDAPKRLLFVPGSIVELDGPQRARRWEHNQIAACSEKTFLFRDVALEIYFKDSRSQLMVFLDRKRRSSLTQRLTSIINRHTPQHPSTPGILRTPGFGGKSTTGSNKFSVTLKAEDLATATRKWQAREISNFTYISILNQVSGRTPSDATQYPVFPWVLQDYTSETLDLSSPSSYRDLTKPMGAQTPQRQEGARTRYENLESVDEKPFHYGTHFSSSMIVCHFMIRLAPFTNMFKTLQGGDWDLPDRLFSDLARAYESAAHDIRGDVRELIPEFFTCPEFLENSSNHDFGVQQSGERIHDVKLPPWAKGDPLLFITLHRRALESDYVSEHLASWIDLIWGYKQKDPESLNVYHPLSYEGAINLDEITDELEREATVGIIHNFGQTPRKLFNTPHPTRYNHGLPTLPLGTLHGIEEDAQLLVQAPRCFRDLGPTTAVRELSLDPITDKILPCQDGNLPVPTHSHEQVEWKPETREIRLLVDHKVIQVIENAFCNCAAFIDSDYLVTGCGDYTVRQWRLYRGGSNNQSNSSLAGISPAHISGSNKLSMTLSHIMRIHSDEVVCVAASRTWSVIVSGSKDGSAAIWELNRGGYIRSIWHSADKKAHEDTSVNIVAINDSTGYIATCSNRFLLLHTINGRPIASLDLTTLPSYYSPSLPTVTSLAFHEREYSNMGMLGTGSPDGSISLWSWQHDGDSTVPPEDTNDPTQNQTCKWKFVEVRRLKARSLANGRHPCITALRFLGEHLYHGEETGKSFVWNLPDSD